MGLPRCSAPLVLLLAVQALLLPAAWAATVDGAQNTYEVFFVAPQGGGFTAVPDELVVKYRYVYTYTSNESGQVPLGSWIASAAFGGDPSLSFTVTADKYVDGSYSGQVVLSDTVVFRLSSISVKLYTARIWAEGIYIDKYKEYGDLTSSARLSPVYRARVCGVLEGGDRVVQGFASAGGTEVPLSIGPSTSCADINGIEALPGSTIVVVYRTALFTAQVNLTAPGSVVVISRPYGSAYGHPGDWNVRASIPVVVSGRPSAAVRVSATVTSPMGDLSCSSIETPQPGSYTINCSARFTQGFTSADFYSNPFTATVEVVDELGQAHRFSGRVAMSAVDPSNIADIARAAYTIVSRTLLSGILAATAMLVLTTLFSPFMRLPLLSPEYLRGVMLTLSILAAVFFVGIPYFYAGIASLFQSLPFFSKYITDPVPSDPMSAFGVLFGYYDKLLQKIESDYQVYFAGSVSRIQQFITYTIVAAGVLFAVAAAVGVISLISGAASGAASIMANLGGGVLGLAMNFVGVMMTLATVGGLLIVGVSIARVFLLLASIMLVAVVILGAILILIPSPTIMGIGEQLLGAGILYFLVAPTLGPVAYALYNYALSTALSTAISSTTVALGPVSLVLPFDALLSAMVFTASATMVMALIFTGLGIVLTRSGVAAGIGEVFSSLIWRG